VFLKDNQFLLHYYAYSIFILSNVLYKHNTLCKKISLKIPKGSSEAVNLRRTDNAMVK
jgi:hypothetical protein